jgi:mRNA interferase RelE/StbE
VTARAAWRVEFTKEAAAEFRRLDHTARGRILKFLRTKIAATENPRRLGKRLSGNLSDVWRYRVGDYRILVSIRDDVLLVLVVAVGHRREIYRRR